MLAAAVFYARRGWRGFPGHWLKAGGVCSCPKGAKCDSHGKHPRISEWQKLASTDEGWLKGWFKKQWPNANPCILTCEASGLCVVDFDFPAGGDATLGKLCDRHGDGWLDTLPVRTVRGIHLYYQYPKGLYLRNTAGRSGRALTLALTAAMSSRPCRCTFWAGVTNGRMN